METPWLEIVKLLVVTTVAVFLEPLFWGILAIIAYQYWQLQKQQLENKKTLQSSPYNWAKIAAFYHTQCK